MATSFSGGRSRSTWREPPTMAKQLVNCITCGCESSVPWRSPLAQLLKAFACARGVNGMGFDPILTFL
jgi:hypothetical protein